MDKPPLLILAMIMVFAGIYLSNAQKPPQNGSQAPTDAFARGFLEAPRIPFYPKRVYGIEVDECFYKILEGESRFDPTICNQEYGCGSGIGLGQLTAIAIADCEKELVRIDPFNPHSNLKCSLWLYEKYGTAPWGTEDSEWGSWNYWKSYCI